MSCTHAPNLLLFDKESQNIRKILSASCLLVFLLSLIIPLFPYTPPFYNVCFYNYKLPRIALFVRANWNKISSWNHQWLWSVTRSGLAPSSLGPLRGVSLSQNSRNHGITTIPILHGCYRSRHLTSGGRSKMKTHSHPINPILTDPGASAARRNA